MSLSSFTQVKVDGSFAFESDPNKKYSLYLPSTYDPAIPNTLMLAMHPLNTSRWNAKSWRDTLTQFAESNNLILVCPDGGTDGSIIDPIDLSFTTALLDSVELSYNINTQKIYLMGFSFGGLATYLYGLNNASRFGGFMPIGAAVNGTNEVNSIIQLSNNKAFFLVHGSLDNPNTRFYPLRSALLNNKAIVKDSLMPGVSHTIDFQNRNQILTMAYKWLDSVNCAQLTSSLNPLTKLVPNFRIFPAILKSGDFVTIQSEGLKNGYYQLEILDVLSNRVDKNQIYYNSDEETIFYKIPELKQGTYIINIRQHKINLISKKIIIF